MECSCSKRNSAMKINVRSSNTIKVEVIQLIVKETQLPKIYIIHTLYSKENPIPTPPCLIHNPLNTPHSPQVSNSSFNFCQGPHCMQQTRFCCEILLIMLSHHQNNTFSLEQPCDVARSHPFWPPKKNSSAPPVHIVPFNAVFPLFIYIFVGWNALTKARRGKKRRI